MIRKGGRVGDVNAQPGLVSEPVEEAPLTDDRIPQADCPNCLALRSTSRLLADASLFLIDRNAELTRQLEAYRERDRRHADALLGLAGLAKAEAGR